ncbi:iron-sulfur cluster co-chaperone protein HscB, mitochondrial [Trichogramma pretiosum]|uniref:iron-sulfur cluster co-chaperone protein HscB, mitochondrial n=1 Tax=Trichogramma pretiosum TaxID=7493 RepID=UPI0006C97CE5|nr:iron-sulfur cluster co-chaperone protein HscB, mitochondrial [Trichogramma pretiosum]XP_014230552.1 iron-sulfur cluster co-chaperone protein HscB, mitochondrial [Trichogramma pretiosum]XP_014230561.1 iron-sulfur cluster co-chaperone protein HscB, mitochondrial [Trichogramma pretiosum]XP_014230569.1 iron-sulfur cluster co-chaperone protein HscB, mitochondrial [Trichogramma pretiosum]XP_014230578.1 iron-sulfur cluster co-chaperone protein HscB, mitochondrial [Trichogramma pretiosum]XP_0142305
MSLLRRTLNKKYCSIFNITLCSVESRSYVHVLPKLTLQPLQSCCSHPRFNHGPPKCWQCDFPHKSELFCSKCKALQKLPQEMNYFDIIGVEKSFDIDVNTVKQKYKKLQGLLHPDKYGQKSEAEKQISENLSALINKAYSTLLDPMTRGFYMLKLQGITLSDETNSSDPEFLMEVMEKNEEIEEASKDKDEVFKFLEENRAKILSLTKNISDAFHNNDIDQAQRQLIKLKYYISIESRLKNLKQSLGIVE